MRAAPKVLTTPEITKNDTPHKRSKNALIHPGLEVT